MSFIPDKKKGEAKYTPESLRKISRRYEDLQISRARPPSTLRTRHGGYRPLHQESLSGSVA